MFFRKTISSLVICTFFLSSCVTNTGKLGSLNVGPLVSSEFFKTEVDDQGVPKPKLDVIIPVFKPGIPEDSDKYEEEGIWPELRRAEANRFALKLKAAIEKTEAFGAIRVTPDKTATGDLYILGTIDESNGEEVEIDLQVTDISGKLWLDKSFELTVKEAFHNNLRNQGKDPYDPVFDEAAQKIAEELKYHSAKDLDDLQYLTNLRFGASFSENAFVQHMAVEDGTVKLVSKPSDDDPMLRRVKAVRVRDQLFVDGLQANYSTFSSKMDDSYLMWQEQALQEVKAEQAAKEKAIGEGVAGVLLVGLAITAAVLGAKSDSANAQTAGMVGATVGGIAGASMIQKSFQTSEEAKIHREALNELGQSLDVELAPQVIEFEKQTVKLTGDATEQFAQWRNFLKKIYAQEATPDKQL